MAQAIWTGIVDLVTRHRDFISGALVTLILKALYDVLKFGSVAGVRQIRNKLSELSVSNLRKRITQLEMYRDAVKSNDPSDRVLHLVRGIVGILGLLCLGLMCIALDTVMDVRGTGFLYLSILVFAAATVVSVLGLRLGELNAQGRALLVATLTSEIDSLRTKLDALDTNRSSMTRK